MSQLIFDILLQEDNALDRSLKQLVFNLHLPYSHTPRQQYEHAKRKKHLCIALEHNVSPFGTTIVVERWI
jgi:hypothetical protein